MPICPSQFASSTHTLTRRLRPPLKSCLPLLLPAVEAGLSHQAWRIRQASVELCGELLFKVAGTSGKVKLDGGSDDECAATRCAWRLWWGRGGGVLLVGTTERAADGARG